MMLFVALGCGDTSGGSNPEQAMVDAGGTSQVTRDAAEPPTQDAGPVLAPDAAAVDFGDKTFGMPCEDNLECETGGCVRVAEDRAVCTFGCDLDDETTCPAAVNWACLLPNEVDIPVCACQSDASEEICADGLDNDCDGFADNCRECAGLLIGPTDPNHCGACGRACIADATCFQGECICPDGTKGDDCVRDPDAPECATGGDCNDGIPCTEDLCTNGRCVNTVVPARCGASEVCDLRKGGCVEGKPCAVDADCTDDDPCTTSEFCDPPTRVCLWLPLDGDADGQPPRVCGGNDCNDADALTFTGAAERCDGIDNSCNGVVDSPIAESACEEDQICSEGDCVCTDGLIKCSGLCFDTETDASHCGGCDNVCPPGAICDDSTCKCPDTLTECSDGCFDLQTNDAHCSDCNQACGTGTVCEDGGCVDFDECAEGTDTCNPDSEDCTNTPGGFYCTCASGYSGTAGACTDINECLSSLNNDCFPGGCVNVAGSFDCECPNGYTGDGRTCDNVNECSSIDCGPNGACMDLDGSFTCDCDPGYAFDGIDTCELVNSCEAGLDLPEMKWCNGACRTLATDNSHCGDCNISCANGTCTNGGCTCNSVDLTFCPSSGCVDLDSNAAHCSACDDPCPTGASCVGGGCFCPVNQMACGGACVTLGTVTNCSACGDACPAGASCATNTCTCPVSAPDVCDDTCVDTQTDENHCSDCGDACPAGATCNGGTCDCPVDAPDVCNDTCVDVVTDEAHCGACGYSCDVVCSSSTCAIATQVAAGDNASCALLSDQTVWCWGTDGSGILGDGAGASSGPEPRPAVGLSNVLSIAMGVDHACAIVAPDSLYCWGENGYNQVAQNNTTDRYVPELVRTGVAQVVVGTSHTCVVLTDDSIECVGNDGSGQHGDGDTVTANNTWSSPTGLTAVDKLVSGGSHLCALDDGTLYCWGYNANGELGVGTNTHIHAPTAVSSLSGVDDVDAGYTHTCAVVDGEVKCWGANTYLQLGITGTGDRLFPANVPSITTAVSVTTGHYHTCATLTDNEIVCWGNRADGRLGDGGATSGSTATAVTLVGGSSLSGLSLGDPHGCALGAGGEVFCWGDGSSTLANGSTVDINMPTEVMTW